jgi:hypothetical protein
VHRDVPLTVMVIGINAANNATTVTTNPFG